MIIGFCGKAGAGKSQTADFMCEKYLVHPVAFADPLRMMVAPLALMVASSQEEAHHYLYDGKDKAMPHVTTSARQLYRDFGDAMRKYDPDVFINLTALKVNLVKQFYKRKSGDPDFDIAIVVDDIRYNNEAKFIKDKGGIIIKVDRPAPELRKVPKHSSENGIDDKYIDFTIANDSTLYDLRQKAYSIGDMYGLAKGAMEDLEKNKPEVMRVH